MGTERATFCGATQRGNVAIWFMNGAQVGAIVGSARSPSTWTVAGVADFNGDGKGDILWRDDSPG